MVSGTTSDVCQVNGVFSWFVLSRLQEQNHKVTAVLCLQGVCWDPIGSRRIMQTVSGKKYLGFSIIQKAFFVMVEEVASIVLRVFYMEFYDSEKISKKALKVLSKFNTDSSLKWLMNDVPFNILSGCKEARKLSI